MSNKLNKRDLVDFIDYEIDREREYLSSLNKNGLGNSYGAGNSVGVIDGLQKVRNYITGEE